jgi:uncharacterized cofD-like protein
MTRVLTQLKTEPSVVALGGGHGLSNALRALRRVTTDLTAIVGVSDDGGSSGRLRVEFGVLPPGDLRMALAALCGDDMSGRTWSRVIQHRFGGQGDLAGHTLGNLMMTALWQEADDPVVGLTWMATLLDVHGTVLPCSTTPITICARLVTGEFIHGQAQVATVRDPIAEVWIDPDNPEACAASLDAIAQADVLILGPGSWYTSVLPHLMIPQQREALSTSSAQRVLITNVQPNADRETRGLPLTRHLELIRMYAPELRFDWVLVDPSHVDDGVALEDAATQLGARVHYASVERPDGSGQHDPDLLSAALRTVLGVR